MASMMACRFDPRPEAKTATRSGLVRLVDILYLRIFQSPCNYFPDPIGLVTQRRHSRHNCVGSFVRDNEDQPDAHVEDAKHFFAINLPQLTQRMKQRRDRPGFPIDSG